MRGHCLFSTDTCYKGGPSGERTLSVSVLIPVIKDPLDERTLSV